MVFLLNLITEKPEPDFPEKEFHPGGKKVSQHENTQAFYVPLHQIFGSALAFFEQTFQGNSSRLFTPTIPRSVPVFREHKIIAEIGFLFFPNQLRYGFSALFRSSPVEESTIETAPQVSTAGSTCIPSAYL
jgi:hypothetical protein